MYIGGAALAGGLLTLLVDKLKKKSKGRLSGFKFTQIDSSGYGAPHG